MEGFAGVALYAGAVSALALVRAWIWHYATDQHRLVDPDMPEDMIQYQFRVSLLAVVIFLVSIPIALINACLAQFSWFFLRLILFWITSKGTGRSGNGKESYPT